MTLLLLCFGAYFNSFGQVKDCKEIEGLQVHYEIQQTTDGKNTIFLKFNDQSLADYAVWMTSPDHEQRIYKNGEKIFENLKSGDYEFIIVVRNGCSKKIEIKVK